jgi:uncharacterized protein YjaZ
MADVNYSLIFGVVFGIMGAITAVWSLIMRLFWSSFSKHKESVQYKDVCQIHVKSFNDKIDSTRELLETKFENLDKNMDEIKDLIKKNGHENKRPNI